MVRRNHHPKHFSIESYSLVSPLAFIVDLSSKNSQASKKFRVQTLWTYPMEIEYAGTYLIQVRVVHISSGNWICRHQSLVTQNSCTYPTGIEHASMKPYASQKVRMQILCTYPVGIEYVGTDPIQVRSCAYILQELNKQAHYTNFGHISYENWTFRYGWRGRDRDRDQGQPEARASLEQVEMEIEDKYHPERFEARAPGRHHRYISF